MGIRNLPAHKHNPFIKSVVYQKGVKRTVVKGGKAIFDEKTGQIEGIAEVVQRIDVDADKFVKLYTADLKRFFSLTPTAQKMLRLVLEQVQAAPNADLITLNVPLAIDYAERAGEKPPARQTFYKVVEEMVDKGFLARSALHLEQYFINPAIFFNGDRVRLVKEYQIRRQAELPLNSDNIEERT